MSNMNMRGNEWYDPEHTGATTASLVVVLLSATLLAGIAAVILEAVLPTGASVIVAGLIGTVAAGLLRNTLLVKVCESAGIYASRTPYSVLMCGALVSLAGSFVAYQMAQDVAIVSPMVTGMLAGAISGTLLGIMIATHRH